MEEFECDLCVAMDKLPAPPGLKRKVMERRRQQRAQRHRRVIWWQRLAASMVLACMAGGSWVRHNAEENRKGEEARQQVLTALRITNHALEQVNKQLQELSNEKE
jgi:hypothetical protein